MSEEINEIFSRHTHKIIENTIPEKREETAELLGSIILEIGLCLEKINNNIIKALKQIESKKQED